MPTRITATEASRQFSDILNRVRYRGESFVVERSGEVVARIAPIGKDVRPTLSKDLAAFFKSRKRGDLELAKQWERAVEGQGIVAPEHQWDE